MPRRATNSGSSLEDTIPGEESHENLLPAHGQVFIMRHHRGLIRENPSQVPNTLVM